MRKLLNASLRLGIIAGGQLGKMLVQEASKWDIVTYVLDPDENCPAAGVANTWVKGSQVDFDSVYKFGKLVDVLTFEIENINTAALYKLKSEGLKIVPDPSVLELVQDKGLQKKFYHDTKIPTSGYQLYGDKSEIVNAILLGKIHTPFVQKLREGGYDGRGVAVINSHDDIGKLLEGASVIEEKIDIVKEIAVIAARNANGETRCFPAVEMVFDKNANLIEKLICPSSISPEQARKANSIAIKLTETIGVEGLLAVEFFVDNRGEILVNEIAPRPHNSGHHTIESVITSQFEQHLRAILNLPLGSTAIKMPSVLLNLIGEAGYEGPVAYEGLLESMAIEGVKIHLYGKKNTRPSRKMGHVTIVARSLEEALYKASRVKKIIKVKSWEVNS